MGTSGGVTGRAAEGEATRQRRWEREVQWKKPYFPSSAPSRKIQTHMHRRETRVSKPTAGTSFTRRPKQQSSRAQGHLVTLPVAPLPACSRAGSQTMGLSTSAVSATPHHARCLPRHPPALPQIMASHFAQLAPTAPTSLPSLNIHIYSQSTGHEPPSAGGDGDDGGAPPVSPFRLRPCAGPKNGPPDGLIPARRAARLSPTCWLDTGAPAPGRGAPPRCAGAKYAPPDGDMPRVRAASGGSPPPEPSLRTFAAAGTVGAPAPGRARPAGRWPGPKKGVPDGELPLPRPSRPPPW